MKIAPTHYGRGLRHLAGVALGVLAATSDIAPALAQRVVPEVRTGGGGTVVVPVAAPVVVPD